MRTRSHPGAPLARRVQNTVFEAVVVSAGLGAEQRIVAAVSGGYDSTVLLDALRNVRDRGGPQVHVAHFDHGLREEGVRIARAVATRAQELGLAATVGRPETDIRDRPPGVSLEMAARDARWRFLRQVAATDDAARVVTGHSLDDQTETVLMNLARGAGARGLRGMRPDDGEILRPLLSIARRDIRAYLRARGLSADDDDATNRSPEFRRNRVRHELVPLLEDIYPGAGSAIARAASVLADEARRGVPFVASLQGVRMPQDPARIGVAAGPLLDVLPEAMDRVRPAAPPIGAAHIGPLVSALADGGRGRWVQLPAGIWAFARARAIALYPRRVADPPILEPIPLVIPSATRIPGGDLFAALIDRERAVLATASPDRAYLDGDAVASGLQVRTSRPGERFRPLGARRDVDISRFLARRRVPAALRAGTPIVYSRGRAVWVVGVEIAADVAVRPATCRVLQLDVRWDPPPVRTPLRVN